MPNGTQRQDTLASVLAINRFPTAPEGKINYERDTCTSKAVARAVRRGDALVVVHGVDDSAGRSELDSSLPAEATDPALCGVLRRR